MTDKELRRLRRQDLLQMLVAQTKEAARLDAELREKKEEIDGLQESLERLKGKLDEKDEMIGKLKEERTGSRESQDRLKEKLDAKDAMMERLKRRLNHKDERIQELEEEMKVLQGDKWRELEDDGTAAEVLLRLRALFR